METESTAVLSAEMPASEPVAAVEQATFQQLPEQSSPGENLTTTTPNHPSDESSLRSFWEERIREEKRLPLSLRARLAAIVSENSGGITAGEEPSLSVSQVANLFAEVLPSFLTTSPQVAEHPQGERFFQGDAVTNEEAANIARQQLERTGFQRVS